MDINSDEYQLKQLLVDFESQHRHLQVSIDHLKSEVEKRQLEVEELLAERELEQAKRENANQQARLMKSQSVDFDRISQANTRGDTQAYSSQYTRQVDELVKKNTKTLEELTALIKL